MDLGVSLHDVYYYSSDKITLGIVPSLDKIYYSTSEKIKELPRKIINREEPIFARYSMKKRHKRVLVLTNACNLSCSYCFEGQAISHCSMTPIMVEEIIEGLFKEASNNNAKLVSFSLFGGEPTIVWDCVLKAVTVANEMSSKTGIKCIKAIVTNGAMETYKAEYISKNFDNIYFSLDGPKELFLKQRKPKSGDHIFDVIFNNALLVYNSGANISFKSTITKHTIDKMIEIDEFFVSNFPFAGRLFQPVMVEETSDLYISFDEFIENFSVVKKYSCFPQNLYMPLFKDGASDRFCNLAVRNVIYPDNTVLACHRSNMCVSDDLVKSTFTIGVCKNGNIERFEGADNFVKQFNINSIEKCKDCFVKYHCCGGCPTIKLLNNKDPLKSTPTYCEAIKEYYLNSILSKIDFEEPTRPNFNELKPSIDSMNEGDFKVIFREVL